MPPMLRYRGKLGKVLGYKLSLCIQLPGFLPHTFAPHLLHVRPQVKAISEELGCEFLGLGFDPKWAVDQIPMMPKDRYNLMRAYMPTVGSMGLDMMFRTCTVQVRRCGGDMCGGGADCYGFW